MSLDLPPIDRKKAGPHIGGLVILLVAVVPLGLLAAYLLSYDYKVDVPGRTAGAERKTESPAGGITDAGRRPGGELAGLKAEMLFSAEDLSPDGTCWFEIRNEGPRKVRILDCANPGKVLTVEIFQTSAHPDAGTGSGVPGPGVRPVSIRPGMSDAWRGRGGFSEEEDAVVELLPGSCWRKRLDLSRVFDLGRPGIYEAAIAYDPRPLEDSGGADLKKLGVERGFARAAKVRFKIPARKSEP